MSISVNLNIDWKFCLGVAGIILAARMDSTSVKEAASRMADAVADTVAARISAA